MLPFDEDKLTKYLLNLHSATLWRVHYANFIHPPDSLEIHVTTTTHPPLDLHRYATVLKNEVQDWLKAQELGTEVAVVGVYINIPFRFESGVS